MQNFVDLLETGALFTLQCLENRHALATKKLRAGARTQDVKALQMISLQKAVLAAGLLGVVEARLQDRKTGRGGFEIADECLDKANALALKQRFGDIRDAINVLKHGEGRSYERLLKRANKLHFRIKARGQHFFREGDVSEVATLIQVDETFIREAVATIREVMTYVK